MTDEEINRKFDVVAEHLAALAIGLQGLQETQRRAEERWERTEGSIRALLAAAEIQAGEIRALAAGQAKSDEKVAALADAQRETDERLNALINTVERYIIGRNGQS